MDLSAARVLITGASRGIEIAGTLHAQGATIIGTARSEASIVAAVEELDIIPVVGDLNAPRPTGYRRGLNPRTDRRPHQQRRH